MGKPFCIKVEIGGVNEALWALNTDDQNSWVDALRTACKKPAAPPLIIGNGGSNSSSSQQDIKINMVTPAAPAGGVDPNMLAYQQMMMQQQFAQQQAAMQAQYQQQLQMQHAAYQSQLNQVNTPTMVPIGAGGVPLVGAPAMYAGEAHQYSHASQTQFAAHPPAYNPYASGSAPSTPTATHISAHPPGTTVSAPSMYGPPPGGASTTTPQYGATPPMHHYSNPATPNNPPAARQSYGQYGEF